MKAQYGLLAGLCVCGALLLQLPLALGQSRQEQKDQPPAKTNAATEDEADLLGSAPDGSSAARPILQEELGEILDSKLGSKYRYGATGDEAYDCSGLVWSAFHDIGIDITRMSSREMYRSLPEPPEESERQLGTLVFFKGLKHVGIVKDGASFYHASRGHGVILSKFSGYWEERVQGYRTVPEFNSVVQQNSASASN